MKMLVGYSGFVGSNLKAQHDFDLLINSRNIETAFLQSPELLIYSGVPSQMFIANSDPEKDKQITDNAFENIVKINAKYNVLISTVAVYDKTDGVCEDSVIDTAALTPYGKNRLALERKLEEYTDDHLIIRLPAIYGENLKKNFIYDFINYIPALLKADKYAALSKASPVIKKYYADRQDGFFSCTAQSDDEKKALRAAFKEVGFSALNFTDSRSVYQFFDLKYLYEAITVCMQKGIKKINLTPPPVRVSELYQELTGEYFINECSNTPFNYNIKTKYTQSGYIMTKEQSVSDIRKFIAQHIQLR